MPTGSGKTAVLMMTPYVLLKKKVLVVTPSKVVRGQISEGVIPSIIKILNQFTSNYGVLHEADAKLTSKGTGNPAWTVNTRILSEVNNSSDVSNTVLIACKTNFEDTLLNVAVSKDKPYHTLRCVDLVDENINLQDERFRDKIVMF